MTRSNQGQGERRQGAWLPDVMRQKLTVLKGVSSRRASLLRGLELETLWDLLRYFPRVYQDWTSLTPVGDLQDGEEQVFLAQVARAPGLRRKGRLTMVQTVLRDSSGSISATWFNQPYMVDKLKKGEIYLFRGKIRRSGRYFDVANPHFEQQHLSMSDVPQAPEQASDSALPSPEAEAETFVRPIYPLTQGLTQAVIRDLVSQAMQICLPEIPEVLPSWIRRRAQLAAVAFAYEQIHFPADRESYLIARRRLAFEELFLTQLGLRLARRSDEHNPAFPLQVETDETIRSFEASVAKLPFELTEAQKRALRDVLLDMGRKRPMNRLVQGDVGSGKTAVAALAMRYASLAGAQSVMMAPTSILARQHYDTLLELLPDMKAEILLLTGQTPAAERRRMLAQIADGSCRILVGTHAVLEDPVVFQRLGLAVTDEQHRFGVSQRLRLSQQEDEGMQPHVLVMSATPIPRSLGLILYGDLDVSVIDEKPAGRQAIATYTAKNRDRARILDMVRKRVADGELIYWVCPLIEADKASEEGSKPLVSVEEAFAELSQQLEPDGIQVGMLHGRLKDKEKQETMDRFSEGSIQVLVSTTVIEVGVDQPRATLMVIENAERFGLAQLHQLRGRIGRGERASLCILMSEVTEGIAYERIATLCRTQDGFEIAEADLKLRGPGDFFGTKQHGLPVFRIANLYEDQELLALSSELLGELLVTDPQLQAVENRYLVPALFDTFGEGFAHITL